MIDYKYNISKLFTKTNFGLFFLWSFFIFNKGFAQIEKNINDNRLQIKTEQDSIFVTKKLPSRQDSLKTKKTDSLKVPPDSLLTSTLEDKLYHYAEDYTEVNEKKKFIKLYNQAHIKYQDIDLQAGVIYVDYAKKEVYAGRIPDSLGKLTQRPVFKQGNTETENDSIRFNFETKKALVWNTYTKEGEFSMNSEVSKKFNDSVIFVKNIKFTTSTDREHPEYYFLSKKAKIVPGKKIVIGATQMWVEDVATPFVIPFGFFPLTQTRTSGFLLPTFADTRYGYALTNGGFYWAIGKYLDLKTTGDIYTNGSFGLQLESNYVKRYRYNGQLTFKYNNHIEQEIPEFQKSTNWRIIWHHNRDGKSNPLSNFTANVNFGSSRYYRDSYNYQDVINTNDRLSNEFGSSVTYQKRFADLPISYSLSVNHNQNVNTGKITMTLPQFNLNVSRIYPFAKKGMKNNAFQRINLSYSFDAKQSIQTNDSLFLKKAMWKNSKLGAKHSIPISTNIKLLKYFNLSPQIQYTEVWVNNTIRKEWDPTANDGDGAEKIIEQKGFESFRDISAGVGLSTNLYGTYLFGQDNLIQGIRHTMGIGFNASYHPIFDQFVKNYFNPVDNELVEYTIFDNGMYGKPNITESKALTMSLSNDFEAKVKTKNGHSKKIRFLTATTGYNFLADSLKISKVNLRSTAQITTGLNVNMNAVYDFYALNEQGQNIDKFAWEEGQSIGRIQNFSVSTGYSFSNKTFAGNNDKKDNNKSIIQEKDNNLYTNDIRWSANVSYSFNYKNKSYHPDTPHYKEIAPHTINFKGKISFSPSWDITYGTGLDLVEKDFSYTQLIFHRDLKSWQMSFTWNPLEPKSWYFKINIKSSVLQGIKYDKRKEPFTKFF